jgi:hypothetical protein
MRTFEDGINPALAEDQRDRRNLAVIKGALREHSRALAKIVPAVNNPAPDIAEGTIAASQTLAATRVWLVWNANGPYQVGTFVDGGRYIPSPFTITAIKLYRHTQGVSGVTAIDIMKNNVSMYTVNPVAKPYIESIALAAEGTPPSEAFVLAGDALSIEITTIEAGNPADLTVIVEGA